MLFALTYVLMLSFSKYRTLIALASGTVFIVSGMLPTGDILPSLDFNVILMIAGTMGLVALFIESKMPSLPADLIMEKVPNIQMAAVALDMSFMDFLFYNGKPGMFFAVELLPTSRALVSCAARATK